jgi:hypothetical protein
MQSLGSLGGPVPVEYLGLASLTPVLNLPFGSVEADAAVKVT